jgi:hypothetical protein
LLYRFVSGGCRRVWAIHSNPLHCPYASLALENAHPGATSRIKVSEQLVLSTLDTALISSNCLTLALSHLPCQIKFNFTLVADLNALNAATTSSYSSVLFHSRNRLKSTQLAAHTNSYLRNSQESSRISQTSLHVTPLGGQKVTSSMILGKGAPCVQGFETCQRPVMAADAYRPIKIDRLRLLENVHLLNRFSPLVLTPAPPIGSHFSSFIFSRTKSTCWDHVTNKFVPQTFRLLMVGWTQIP